MAASEQGIGSGKLRNDVWVGQLTTGSQSPWQVDDRYFADGGTFNPELIRSKMTWHEVTPGRVAPATWTSGPKYSLPLTYDEWIACQDSIKDRLDYTIVLPDPSVCDDPPQFCYDDVNTPGCHAQSVWKKDNMWSPRRGLAAAVISDNKIFVIGGQAREYARIEDTRLVGGLNGQKRIETVQGHSTIREELALKNDVWTSEDGGATWKLVNPGCKDMQEDVLIQTEVWSRDHSNSSLPKYVGSIGSKCHRSSDCYGVAECKALGNTYDKVCVCPMFSPRMHHTVTVQHRFSVQEDGSIFSEDVIYVIGGFTSVKQAFCGNRSCGPADGYRLAMDDAWMSTDGINWTQIKPAFDQDSSFHGRGSHTALVVHSYPDNNATELAGNDRLLIFGGETSNPQELSITYLNDIWQVNLPKEPCCIELKGCRDAKIYNAECTPSPSDWNVITTHAEWQERSGHTSVYEPPSSGNSFRHRIYLSGGKNAGTVFSATWTWDLLDSSPWHCDFSSDANSKGTTLGLDAFLSIDSPLADVKRIQLPSFDNDENLLNASNHSVSPIVSDKGISVMASEGVKTMRDLSSADLYSVLKLRGFDYPGRYAQEVTNVCYLRAISIAFVEKCSIENIPKSFYHKQAVRRIGQSSHNSPSQLCGRGGESKPCVRGDWDGCTPIPGVSKVDVHGLGDVVVPQHLPNVSSVLEEMFCRQVPGARYLGAAEFLDSKLVLLGGIGSNSTRLYRDVWTRDDVFPQAFITTKPLSQSPQSKFYFDSNEAGAHVFEYKLLRNGTDIIPWTITTKHLGADVSWLDDKKGGPGKGWYILFLRAVDPSGNRDGYFSMQTNVYRWVYVPPIPWGFVSGFIIASLLLIIGGYYEHRRRKKKATLQRFQLRRLRRKFKLRSAHQEAGLFPDKIPNVVNGGSHLNAMEQTLNSRKTSRRSSHRRTRKGEDRSPSRTHRSRGSMSREEKSDHRSHRSRRSRRDRSGHQSYSKQEERGGKSHHRSRSRGDRGHRSRGDISGHRSDFDERGESSGLRRRRRKRRTEKAEDERRAREQRNRELWRREERNKS